MLLDVLTLGHKKYTYRTQQQNYFHIGLSTPEMSDIRDVSTLPLAPSTIGIYFVLYIPPS
jgi:hypothetical protein